jgi:IS605 OrfB family transposase
MFKTYQTKLKNYRIVNQNNSSIPIYEYFHHNATIFGTIERMLFVDLYVHHKLSKELKVSYCANYHITARQYNSIKKQLDGRVSSKKELIKLYIDELKTKMKKTNELIKTKIEQKEKKHQALLKMKGNETNFEKKVTQYRKLRNYIHQKKRKLHSMKLKLERLVIDQKNDITRICFGSKELFQKQFHLEENDLTFKKWKKEWQEKRASQFTFIGSKDETYGNQSCTYDEENNLRIRVFSQDEEVYGNYVTLPNVTFPYGQEAINIAKVPYVGYTNGKGRKKNYYRALTWKFIRKNDAWYATVTVDVDMPSVESLENNGLVAIDFNANFLAVTEIDRYGNPLDSFQVPLHAYHVTSEQAEQSLSIALKTVVEYAKEKQKPIAYEDLDFKKKKQNLKQMNPKQAKLLSGFAYSSYKTLLKNKCEMGGVKLKSVHPAYTSQIGHHKFMKKYGLSSHASASLVIGRRSLQFNKMEKVPVSHFIKNNESLVHKDRFTQWKELVKQWKTYNFNQKLYLLYQL